MPWLSRCAFVERLRRAIAPYTLTPTHHVRYAAFAHTLTRCDGLLARRAEPARREGAKTHGAHEVNVVTRALYEQAGSEAGISAVLDDLYTRVFSDPMIGFLFAGHDKDHIVRAQTAFTRRMLGDASAVYSGKSMPDAHAELPILAGHFDRRHHLLAHVLRAHGLPEEVREAWLRLDQGLRTSVMRVGRARADALNRDDEEE